VFDGEDQFGEALSSAFADRGLAEAAAPEVEGTPVESAPPEPAAAADDAGVDGQLRDEKGRYASSRELEEKLSTLEKRLADKDEFIGRQSTELGTLRQQWEAFQAQQAQPQYDYDSLIDQDPAAAAMAAYDRGDQYELNRAVQAWNEVAPGAPRLWAQNLQMQQTFEERIAELDKRSVPVQQHYQQQQQDTANQQAVDQIRGEYTDFGAYAPSILEQIQGSPRDIQRLSSGDPEEIKDVLERHYFRAKMRAGDTLTEAATVHAQQAAEDTRAAKLASAVASSASSPSAREGTGAIDAFRQSIVGAQDQLGLVDKYAAQ
jgi:uncharacterized coiled-coil protein SlyX